MITLTDMFGFECFHRNRTEQLMINSLNEQIQYHYNQRMFVWEMMEQVSELLCELLICYDCVMSFSLSNWNCNENVHMKFTKNIVCVVDEHSNDSFLYF